VSCGVEIKGRRILRCVACHGGLINKKGKEIQRTRRSGLDVARRKVTWRRGELTCARCHKPHRAKWATRRPKYCPPCRGTIDRDGCMARARAWREAHK